MPKDYICHICGGHMRPCVEPHTYYCNGSTVVVQDAHCFKCENCDERILESQEVKRIEKIVLDDVTMKRK